jgi:hypothetical protein
VPALPYLYDHPVEHAIDALWEKVDTVVPEKFDTRRRLVKQHEVAEVKDALEAVKKVQ